MDNNSENLRYLANSLEKLTNIDNLRLNLSRNSLGKDPNLLMQIGKGIKNLKNLHTLSLDMSLNVLENNQENLSFLLEGLQPL